MGIDIGGALNSARNWVGDRLDDVEGAKNWAGEKIDGAVHSAEDGIDGFRQDLVQFGEEHGGIVGKTLAQGVSNTIGASEGATLAVYDMGKGVVQLADGAGKLANPLEWATHGDRNLQRLENVGRVAQTLDNLTSPVAWATNPGGNVETAKALWNGVTAGYQDAAKDGDWSKFSGRLVVDVGSLFIGAGEANAAIKGTEGASVLGRLGEGGEAVNTLDKIADGTRALETVRTADAISPALKSEILAIPKGARPNPAEYLSRLLYFRPPRAVRCRRDQVHHPGDARQVRHRPARRHRVRDAEGRGRRPAGQRARRSGAAGEGARVARGHAGKQPAGARRHPQSARRQPARAFGQRGRRQRPVAAGRQAADRQFRGRGRRRQPAGIRLLYDPGPLKQRRSA